MVRSRTWPSPGAGGAQSSTRKSDALGSPTGRETRTTRLACCDMVISSDCLNFDDPSSSLRGANGSGLSAGPMTGSATKQSSYCASAKYGLLRCARNDGELQAVI